MPVSGLDGLDVLDYGCGPGHDLIGIATYSRPASLIGLDVSDRALEIAQSRIALLKSGDQVIVRRTGENEIPLPDSSVDYVHSSGVLHHVPDLKLTLGEISRILRPGGRVRIMVYNEDSLWWHLYVPYVLQIRRKILDPSMSLPEAFRMSTDGFDCPISVTYTKETFAEIADSVGFQTKFVGTSISVTEVDTWRRYAQEAKKDKRLAPEHRDFLSNIWKDSNGRLSIPPGRVPGINLVLELIHK
jgi:ubiquinone/menaquinone biosynthesis C-methylase UbiE